MQGLRLPAAIPPLRGTAASVYLAFWLALLVVFLIGTVGEVVDRLHAGAGSVYTWVPLGFQPEIAEGKPYRVVAPIASAARTAGINESDVILTVEGISTEDASRDDQTRSRIAERLLVGEGAAIHIEVQSAGKPPRGLTLLHRAATARELLAPAGLSPSGLTYGNTAMFLLPALILIAGAALLVGRRSEPVAAVLSLALLALASMAGNQGAFWAEHGCIWLLYACYTLGIFALYLGFISFPDGRITPRWTLVLPLLSPLPVLAILLLNAPAWPLALWLLAALAIMVMRYRKEAVDQRRQWKWALIGFAAGISTFFATGLVYDSWYLEAHRTDLTALLWSWIITPLQLALVYAMIVGGLVLSVLRYRLYDTSAAVSRSLVYSVLTLTLVAIFAGSEKIIEIAGEEAFGEGARAYAGGLAAAFAATTIAPLHHRISHWAEHLLRKDLLHLRRELPPHLLELGEMTDAAAVADALLEHIVHGLHAVRAAVVLDGKVSALRGIDPTNLEAWLTREVQDRPHGLTIKQHDPLFPLRLPLARHGQSLLLLGPRPDGSLYGRDERELLAELAHPMTQALSAARRNSLQSQRIDALAQDLAAVRDMLARHAPA